MRFLELTPLDGQMNPRGALLTVPPYPDAVRAALSTTPTEAFLVKALFNLDESHDPTEDDSYAVSESDPSLASLTIGYYSKESLRSLVDAMIEAEPDLDGRGSSRIGLSVDGTAASLESVRARLQTARDGGEGSLHNEIRRLSIDDLLAVAQSHDDLEVRREFGGYVVTKISYAPMPIWTVPSTMTWLAHGKSPEESAMSTSRAASKQLNGPTKS